MSDTAVLDAQIDALRKEIDALSADLYEPDPRLAEAEKQLRQVLNEIQKGRISLSLLYHLLVSEVRYRKLYLEQYKVVFPEKYTDTAEELFRVLKEKAVEIRK